MKTKGLALVLVFCCFACSTQEEFKFPPAPSPPSSWSSFSRSTLPGSDCPVIDGIYKEPPVISRLGVNPELIPQDTTDLYSSYIPFHRAERRESTLKETGVFHNGFAIRQPDATQFFFSYFSVRKKKLVEYHFLLEEGDFVCDRGYVEFPIISSYGVIEGMSVNFQIKNIIFRDEEGALIIQSTGGPYVGKTSKERERFMFEFFKYSLKEEELKTQINY